MSDDIIELSEKQDTKQRQLVIRMSDEEWAAAERLAKRTGLNKQDLIVQLLRIAYGKAFDGPSPFLTVDNLLSRVG